MSWSRTFPASARRCSPRAFARSLGLSFARVQGTPDLLPSDVTGTSSSTPATSASCRVRCSATSCSFDEINRATPRTQSALLEAMQEHQVSVDGRRIRCPSRSSSWRRRTRSSSRARSPCPRRSFDRFLVRVDLGYLAEPDERQMLRRLRDGGDDAVDRISAVVQAADLESVSESVRQVLVADEVEGYLLSIIRATREQPDVRLGASPRSAVALYRMAQAWAALDGRAFVLPDDVSTSCGPSWLIAWCSTWTASCAARRAWRCSTRSSRGHRCRSSTGLGRSRCARGLRITLVRCAHGPDRSSHCGAGRTADFAARHLHRRGDRARSAACRDLAAQRPRVARDRARHSARPNRGGRGSRADSFRLELFQTPGCLGRRDRYGLVRTAPTRLRSGRELDWRRGAVAAI